MSNNQTTVVAEAVLENLRMAQGALSDGRELLDRNQSDPSLANLRAALRDAQLGLLLAIRTSEDVVGKDDESTRPMRPVGQGL